MRRLLAGLLKTLIGVVGLFALMQLVPYGRTHGNPPTTEEPPWDSPRTRELTVRACFNCHSNTTRWPWYANVAPVSWVVEYDVNNARSVINFSEWNRPYDLAASSSMSIKTGDMPPAKYRFAHPESNLTPAETADLIRGLDATLGVPRR